MAAPVRIGIPQLTAGLNRMSDIWVKNGNIISGTVGGTANSIISTNDGAGCPCCQTTGCTLNMQYVDVNGCEDDAFNVYIVNPEDGSERYIFLLDMVSNPPGCCGSDQDGNECPHTTINHDVTVEESDIDACCNFTIRLTFDHANCCNTYATFSMTGTGGSANSQPFWGDADFAFNVADLCGGGGAP